MSVEFGAFLKSLRRRRGLSREKLAQAGGISSRTVSYWESGRHSPGIAEWRDVMRAIDASPDERAQAAALLTTRRGLRMARGETLAAAEAAGAGGTLPDIGDLLRALRVRRGWTQMQLAERIGIGRATVNRWENTRNVPADEHLDRLCDALGALPGERLALLRRRLEPPHWGPELNWDGCLQQIEIISRTFMTTALTELSLLALKRQLHLHLGRVPEARVQLAIAESNHASLLFSAERDAESRALVLRSLAMLDGVLPNDPIHFGILNLAAVHANRTEAGYDAGLRVYDQWLPRLRGIYRVVPLCDMALFLANLKRYAEVDTLLTEAQRIMDQAGDFAIRHRGYHDSTYAQILRASGRPVEAMAYLPGIDDESNAYPSTLMLWAKTLIEAGDRQTAERCLNRVAGMLAVAPNPRVARERDAVARRL